MKKRNVIVPVLFCVVALMSACGAENKAETSSLFETTTTETQSQQETSALPGQQSEQTEAVAADTDVITEEQAYAAVINYNKAIGSGIDEEINSEGYSEYFDVSTNEDGKIVVLYRSYTGAQTYYYVDPTSGETYVTELVPGIIDEEQETGEKFNARDYL